MAGAMEMTPPSAAPAEGNGSKEIRKASFGPSASPDHSRRGFRKVDSFVAGANSVSGVVHGQTYARNEKMPTLITLRLAFQTLGIVFGDLGTSPLYVYDAVFVTLAPTKNLVLGALSLIFYTLLLVPLIKYVFIVLRANDRGNGGTFALYSLIARVAGMKVATNEAPEDHAVSSYNLLPKGRAENLERAERIKEFVRESRWLQLLLLTIALFGTCCVIGDGVLTPAISVLSAMSGIKTNFPSVSQDIVTYSSAGILFILFCAQRFGTDKVGFMFSPIILLWFISIFLIGAYNVHYHPAIFKAVNPYYIYVFFRDTKREGWIALGGIVLAITGTEAMFADLGHFSVASIQISFSTIVFPALIMAYTGQAAYLIHDPSVVGATFYKQIPHGLFWPEFLVATAAAIIASQAMISATYSIVEQSMALGCFPKCKIVHTSKKFAGQIYIPEVNWLLMVLTIIVTIGFRTGTQIGNAYGVAVVSVMLVTTCFLTLVILMVWQMSPWIAFVFWVVFFTVEGVYYSSTLYKIPQGGWVSLAFVGVFFTVMYIWNYGRRHSYKYEVDHKISLDWVLGLGSSLGMVRVPGVGLVYTELAQGVPSIFAHLTTNLPAVHSILVFVCVKHLPIPYVPEDERLLIRRVGPRQYHMYRIALRYGYAELVDNKMESFERHLIDSLASFIRTEGEQLKQQQQQQQQHLTSGGSKGSNSMHEAGGKLDYIDAALEQSHRSSIDFSSELIPKVSSDNADTSLDQDVEEELALLEHSRQSGIVYLLGHTEVKATDDSNFFRKFIIDYAYKFIRQNTRGSSLGLGIPPTRLVQIGMLHHI